MQNISNIHHLNFLYYNIHRDKMDKKLL